MSLVMGFAVAFFVIAVCIGIAVSVRDASLSKSEDSSFLLLLEKSKSDNTDYPSDDLEVVPVSMSL